MLNISSRTARDDSDVITFALIRGTDEDDTLTGGAEDDNIRGFNGNDALSGRGGEDTLKGGAGEDSLTGGANDDLLKGGRGNDDFNGGDGKDNLRGGQGDDAMRGGAGDDFFKGGAGEDRLTGGSGADTFRIAGDGECDMVTDYDFLFEGDRIDAVGFSLLLIDVDLGLGISTAFFDNNNDGIADACIQVNGVLDPISIIL